MEEELRRDRGVAQRPPGTAADVVEVGGHLRHMLLGVLRRAQAGPTGEHPAQIRGEPLVHPEQLGLLRLLVVAEHEIGGTPVLTAPGVDVLVRQQTSHAGAQVRVDEGSFGHPVVARLVVLEAEVGDLVAERQQEVVAPVVTAAEERVGFADQLLVGSEQLGSESEARLGVAGHVEDYRRRLVRGEPHAAEVRAHEHRRIDERDQ